MIKTSLLFDGLHRFSNFSHFLVFTMILRPAFCIISLLLMVFLSGCGTDKLPSPSQPELLTAKIFGDNGHFRSNKIGNSLEEVVEHDRDFLFKRRSEELGYSIPLAANDSAHYDVSYYFKRNRLVEIQVDVLLGTEKKTEKLLGAFVGHLREKYGDPSEKTGYAYWEITNQQQRLEITLRDVSREHNRPFLSLNFVEPDRFNP